MNDRTAPGPSLSVRSVWGRLLFALAVLAAAVVTPIGVSIAPAAGTPDIGLAKTMPAKSLAGADIPVTLSISNTQVGAVDGFNLTITDVLPSGVSYVADSADPNPTATLLGNGTTVLVWKNLSDSLAGTTVVLDYKIRPDASNDVGSTITNSANAYVNSDTTVMPIVDAATGAVTGSSYTGSASGSAQTEITAFALTKSSGVSESEQLRGLHMNQEVYTLKIENNLINPTASFSIVDYLPAQLEFLACGGVDNSSADEYVGSGAINPGNEPTLTNPCIVPSSVTTVTTDPDGAGPLTTDVYTRVEWDVATLATDLTTGGTFLMDYIAAIPLRENVQASLANTTANVDNNTGQLTTETEGTFANYASASGFYNGSPSAVTDDASLDIVAEDVALKKSVDNEIFVQGDTPTYTLLVESSEYASATGVITVTDIVPATLDVTGASPAIDAPPGEVLNSSNGTIAVTWTIAGYTGPNGTTTITLNTMVRDSYRLGDGSDGGAISSKDSFVNTASLSTSATVLDGSGSTLVVPVVDEGQASQRSNGIVVTKEVSTPVAGALTCGDGTGVTFQSTVASSYRPGDRICYRLLVDFPASMDTLSPVLTDFLPDGVSYESWTVGAASDLPTGDFTFANNGGRLDWALSTVDALAVRAEIIVQVKIQDPLLAAPGDDPLKNYLKLRYFNTDGEVFQDRDDVDFAWSEPTVTLSKGVLALNSTPVAGGPLDGVSVIEGDIVTYQVAVSNAGTEAALDVSVRDVLPAALSCGDVTSISNGGTCDVANKWIQWDAADDIDVGLASTVNLTYDVTIPVGTSAAATLTNTAGVRTFTGLTNSGTPFTYVPADNIDSTLVANTDAAGDTSSVITAPPVIDKTRTTAITETGNTVAQATIGETISYTVDLDLPNDISFYNAELRDPLDARLDLDHTSVVVTLNGSATLPAGFTVDVDDGANSITVDFPPSYIDTSGTPPAFQLTFDATVVDDETIKRTVVPNVAYFDYETLGGSARSVNADIGTQVVEPNLTLAKSDDDADGIAIPGQTIAYSLVVGNDDAVSFVSAANDTVIVDTVPSQLIVDVGSISGGGVYVAGATSSDPGTITWTITKLDPGASTTLTYNATTANPLLAAGPLVNSAVATTTSMAGTVTGERTVLSAGGDAVGEGYLANSQNTLTVAGWSLTKTAAPSTATVGETITYTAVLDIPANLIGYDVTILDDLPAGLTYESLTSVVCSQGGGSCTPDLGISDVDVITGGGDVAFFFDDITSPSTADRSVTITYVAYVADVSAADSGSTLTNSAKVHWNLSDTITSTPGTPPTAASFAAASAETSDDVGTLEPVLVIDKDVGGQALDTDLRRAKPGDVLTYTVTITNTGNTPAHNANVTDVIVDDSWAFTDTTTAAGVTNTDANPVGGLTWTVDGPIAASGGTAVITYELVVPAGYDSSNENATAVEQSNTADVSSYFAVAAADRAANSGRTYRDYDNVTADVVGIELDLASVGDLVWFDVDKDGVVDSGEPILANVDVTVTYLGPDGVVGGGDDEVFATTTGNDGKYLVEDLPGGQYTVDVDENDPDFLPGLTPSYDLDGSTTSPNGAWAGAVAEDADKLDVDFGYTGAGSIGDSIWFDQDRDGVVDTNEAGFAGVDVTVTWLGPDGVAGGGDDIVYSDTTDSSGKYLIANVPDGLFTVIVDTGDLPAGMTNVSEPGSENDSTSTVTVSGSSDELGQDFGYAGTGSIGDTIYLDQNGDGDQDSGEPGLGGVTLEVRHFGPDGVSGGPDDSTFAASTAANGSYLVENLPPGEYEVTVTGALPANVTNSDDPDSVSPGDSKSRLTLTDGQNNLLQDFGYNSSGTLGDRIWWDVNGDGVQDTAEPGLNGIEVTLTYFGPDGVLGGVDDEVFVTTTSGDGGYLFSNLPDGAFTVAVTDGVSTGFDPSFDEDSGLVSPDETIAVSLTAGHLTADFGYVGTGGISDTVWFDTDADGVLDSAEFGLESVTVKATWHGPDGVSGGGDDLVLTTTTDSGGNYAFSGLPAGSFSVEVDASTLPAGLSATHDRDDGLVSPDGEAIVLLTTGQQIDTVDFGYNGSGSIGNMVWFDRNGDGVQSADEPGLGNVDVTLVWASPTGPESFSATTGADGTYLFDSLPPGDYTVTVAASSVPAGMTATYDANGGADSSSSLTLADGQDNLAQDFGYRGSASVGTTVYLDLDGDGSFDSGEPGVAGQAVQLTWQGPTGPLVFTTTTDASGGYSFDNLPDGDMTVTVSGGIVGAAANTDDPGSNGDSTNDFTITGGVDNLDQDFGYQGGNSLGDQVWFDLNANGQIGALERGLEGVAVTTVWLGPDAVAGTSDDVTLPTTTTDAGGLYNFSSLPDGSYSVTVGGGLPNGLTTATYDPDDQTTGPDGSTVLVALGTATASPVDNIEQDFGYAGSGSIGDTVWLDLDRDGIADAGEPAIPGVEVTLIWSGPDGVLGTADDVTYPTQTTDANGHYLFSALPAGPFSVSLTNLPSGVSGTADPDGGVADTSTVSLTTGQADLDQVFGYGGTASVGDLVWLDVDADGIQDPGEPGLANLPVVVTSAGADGVLGSVDDIIVKTKTGSDGSYLVTGLPPGPTSVSYDKADLPPGRTPSSDRDGGDFTVTTFSLAATDAIRDIDFAVVGSTSVSGTLFIDANTDGDQDPGELGLAGVSVIVTWNGPNGPVATTVVTGPDGSWQLDSIPDGDYTVEVDLSTLPPGVLATSPTDTSLMVPLGVNGIVLNGFALSASIGDRVWDDVDGDGVQDPGEPGIAGVVVELRDSDGTLVATTTTDSSGGYRFDGLRPGEYVIELVVSAIPAGRTVVADPDGNNDGSTSLTLQSGDQLSTIDFGLGLSPDLAFTGQEMAWLLAVGAGLLTLGSGFVVASRRRS